MLQHFSGSFHFTSTIVNRGVDPSIVSAVIVTKGDQDLSDVIKGLPFRDVIVWNNALETDRKVFGRYLGIERAQHECVYVQDDDCVVDAGRLCEEYESGEVLCNVLPGWLGQYGTLELAGTAPVGYGAIFPRALADFVSYFAQWPADELFDRECDRVFTWLQRSAVRVIEVGLQHLPQATDAGRMHKELQHDSDEAAMRLRLTTLKGELSK